jgi:HD-GYP domain-containing protein (c-di-GMP phosphodiesterase class II)
MEETAKEHFDPKVFPVFREIVREMIDRGESTSWDATGTP